MSLHIILRLYVAEPDASQCEPINFYCPDLDVKLRNGIKVGRKAARGILIEAIQCMCQFTTLMRWAAGADRIVNHQVQYFVIDDELGAVTDSVVLRSGMSPSLGGFGTHWPLSAKGWTPAAAQLRMELVSRERAGHYADCTNSAGRISERCEMFQVPMVEHGYVLCNSKPDICARIPTAGMAFTASV